MRVLLYTRAFTPAVGGVERFADALAGWLAEHGHEMLVATRTAGWVRGGDRGRYRVLREPSPAALRWAVRRSSGVHVRGLSLRGIAAAVWMSCGRTAQLVSDGRGFVAAGASPEPLAGALRAALHNPDARARAVAAARRLACDRLTLPAIGPAYLAVYEEAAVVLPRGARACRRDALVSGGDRR